MIVMSIEEFAAKRRGDQDSLETELFPYVQTAMDAYPVEGWYNDLLTEVATQYLRVFRDEGGRPPVEPSAAEFTDSLKPTLDKTENPDHNTVERVSVWLSTAILNAGTQAAAATDEEFLVMEWVTMHDEDVRVEHRATEGQQQPPGEPFDVDGVDMLYPGDPSAPIELWINCRCTLAPVLADEATFRRTEGVTMTATDSEPIQQAVDGPLPWHGVLAPEGVWSGDGRQFAPDSLRFRDLPIPLTWQKATDSGHDGSVVVGKINSIERVGGMMNASGTFLMTPEADEVAGLLAEFGRFGVSVDADDAEFELADDDGKVTFTSARIASASIVAIPAFAEAYISLGEWATESPAEQEVDKGEKDYCDPDSPDYDPDLCEQQSTMSNEEFKDYDSKQRKDAHTVPGTDSYPIEDCEDLRNAIQAIGRAKDPAATKKHIKTQKSRLGCPDVEIPKDWSSEVEEFVKTEDGPGWLTHPVDTDRLRDYWVHGEGAAKIGWGTPGDFNRCRANLAKYVKPEFLNGYCANRHYDALGFWPGRPVAADTISFGPTYNTTTTTNTWATATWNGPIDAAGRGRWVTGGGTPSVSLVASNQPKAPAGWFTDPNLTGPTHLTVTEEGRVFGHIAQWDSCHIGYADVCVAPPMSESGYAYFATGSVLLDDGSTARTGVISLGGGHAGKNLRAAAAVAHYDSTSTAVADVCVGEDDHGIWCSGWIRPGTTDEQVVALRASDVSGDWREVRAGQMEMVAALACNVGGFSVGVGVEDGTQVSLVAAGAITTTDPVEELAVQIEQRLAERQIRRNRMRMLSLRMERKH